MNQPGPADFAEEEFQLLAKYFSTLESEKPMSDYTVEEKREALRQIMERREDAEQHALRMLAKATRHPPTRGGTNSPYYRFFMFYFFFPYLAIGIILMLLQQCGRR